MDERMTEWRFLSAAEISKLGADLTQHDWSWRMAEVPELAAAFGWLVMSASPERVILDIGFGIGSGFAYGRGGLTQRIELRVTTFADEEPASRELVHDVFVDMTAALSSTVGTPSVRKPGRSPEIRWIGKMRTLRLVEQANCVCMYQ